MEYGNFDIERPARYGSNIREIEKFMAQPFPMARIERGNARSASSVRAAYAMSIKRHGFPVRVFMRGTTVYLAKEEEE